MALAASRRGLAATLVVLAVAALLALHPANPVRGASITVNTTADELNTDGDCSLREAIQAANLDTDVDECDPGSGADTISLPAGIYTLTLAPSVAPDDNIDGDLAVTADVTIQGAGAGSTIIQACTISQLTLPCGPSGSGGNGGTGIQDRVFHVVSGTLTLSGVTVRHGRSSAAGGGIRVESGAGLVLTDAAVADSFANTDGGGIYNDSGTVTVTDSTISDNDADNDGGGIYNDGTLTVQGSQILRNTADDGAGNGRGGGLYNASAATGTVEGGVVAENTANVEGGGIWNDGALTVRGTAVRENEAGFGGGLYNGAGGTADVTEAAVRDNTAGTGGGVRNAGTLTLERSLLAGNTATATTVGGGGLSNQAGTATLRNTTVSGNRATGGGGDGGGIRIDGGTVRAAFVTVAGNSAGDVGGGVMNIATFEVKGLLLADNTADDSGPDCWGTLTSQGSNLIEDTTDCTVTGTTTGNLTGVDPALGPLGANGGPTETHALSPTSPALDAVAAGQCTDLDSTTVGTDQRGVGRPQDGNGDATATCDIGAFEARLFTLTVTSAGGGSGTVGSGDGGIACPPTCTAAVLEGSTVTLTAAAGAGSVFAGWAGGCTGTAASVLVTVVAPVTCTATFDLAPTPTPLPDGIRLPETGSGGDAARR